MRGPRPFRAGAARRGPPARRLRHERLAHCLRPTLLAVLATRKAFRQQVSLPAFGDHLELPIAKKKPGARAVAQNSVRPALSTSASSVVRSRLPRPLPRYSRDTAIRPTTGKPLYDSSEIVPTMRPSANAPHMASGCSGVSVTSRCAALATAKAAA